MLASGAHRQHLGSFDLEVISGWLLVLRRDEVLLVNELQSRLDLQRFPLLPRGLLVGNLRLDRIEPFKLAFFVHQNLVVDQLDVALLREGRILRAVVEVKTVDYVSVAGVVLFVIALDVANNALVASEQNQQSAGDQ